MATGWWAEAIAYSSVVMNRVTSSMTALMADFATQATAMPKPVASMNGSFSNQANIATVGKQMTSAMVGSSVTPTGVIAVADKQIQSVINGYEQPVANMATALPMMTSFAAGGIAGSMSTALPKMLTTSAGAQAQSGSSSVAMKGMLAALSASQTQAGTMATALSKALTAMSGTELPSGTMALLMKNMVSSIASTVVSGVQVAAVSSNAVEAATMTMPTHSAGNLIVAWAFRDGVGTAPPIPSGQSWTQVDTGAGNSCGFVMVKKIAASSSETVGSFTGATLLMISVFSGASDVGAFLSNSASSNSPAFTGFTFNDTDNTSWAAAFVGHRSVNGTLGTPPTGMTNRQTLDGSTNDGAIHDTNGPVTGWSSQTVSTSETASGWFETTYEVMAQGKSAPAFKSLGTPLAGSSSTAAAVPVPAVVQQFDIILVQFYVETNQTITPPTGFTECPNSPQQCTGTTAHEMRVFWKRATAADTGTYAFTVATGLGWRQAQAICYSGCVQSGSPFDITNGAAKSTTTDSTVPAISGTTTVPTRLVWMSTTFGSGTVQWTTPSGWTQQAAVVAGNGLAIADLAKLTPGATGSITASMGGPTNNASATAWLGALKSG